MTIDIIVALLVAIVLFFALVGIWYFVIVPAKRKALAEEARETAEKEAEVIKQKKLLEVKEKFLRRRCASTISRYSRAKTASSNVRCSSTRNRTN